MDKQRFNKHFGMNAKAALAKKSKRNQLANLKLTQLNIYIFYLIANFKSFYFIFR